MNRKVKQEIIEYIRNHSEPDSESDCILWTGLSSRENYGLISISSLPTTTREYVRSTYNIEYAIAAHKLSFLANGGKYTKSQTLTLHSTECVSKLCLNPNHLRRGNHVVNRLDLDVVRGPQNGNRVTDESIKRRIRTAIIDGCSFYSIAREHNMFISQVMRYADAIENQNPDIKLPQRKP